MILKRMKKWIRYWREYYFCRRCMNSISFNGNKMFNATRACGFTSSKSLDFTPYRGDATNVIKESSNSTQSYEDAIRTLNSLQSNAITIQNSINRQQNHVEDIRKYLQRTGITLDDLDNLSVIHVSGTKGKGSTCALTESILRSFGVRTGFFSSPHLISVTERFRINGDPISKNDFSQNFWNVYNCLNQQKEDDNDMPPYFKFLTIMCFHIFLQKRVDVAILEVGIGGEHDCTNVVRNTKTIGITSLGLEHTRLLGNTLEEIAWQKAGIIKPNSRVFISPQQPENCLGVIKTRAKEKDAQLYIAPDFCEYKWETQPPKLQMSNKIQKLNASLAIQLAYDWLKHCKLSKLNVLLKNIITTNNDLPLEVCHKTIKGLEDCFWPGRGQIVKFHDKTIYLDGAHTKESLAACLDWFMELTNQTGCPKCLIFNAAGERDTKKLLQEISIYNKNNKIFNIALFVPNYASPCSSHTNDDNTSIWSPQYQIQRAKEHHNLWNELNENNAECYDFECMLDALRFLTDKFGKECCDVLITGSIHLIGAALKALETYDKEIST